MRTALEKILEIANGEGYFVSNYGRLLQIAAIASAAIKTKRKSSAIPRRTLDRIRTE